MSRPALYQYFRNKGDIFASAFTALIDDTVDRSLAALDQPTSTAERLDEALQRFEGDLWEQMAASAHSDEILSAKHDHAAEAVAASFARFWTGIAAHLVAIDAGNTHEDPPARRQGWVDVLHLGPRGLKTDGTVRRHLPEPPPQPCNRGRGGHRRVDRCEVGPGASPLP